jgi:hypothetical protein
MWKVTFWTSVYCILPYIVFFGFNRHEEVSSIPVLIMGLIIASVLMYYVLFKAGDLPKIDR